MVTGAGPIGALCVAVARLRGASEIIVTDIQDATLGVAARMGADHTVNTAKDPKALAPGRKARARLISCSNVRLRHPPSTMRSPA